MTKELIYKDAINVLYMMKNHGIRFLYRLMKGFSWGDVRIIDAVKYIENGRGGYAKGTEFKVHPDDVHLYDAQDGDLVGFIVPYGEEIERISHVSLDLTDQETLEVQDHNGIWHNIKDIVILKIKERNDKQWLAPDEIREV